MTRNDLWHAVETRDASQDGAFVYAVRSTGVFCRPSCPSRRPDPERVEFFAAPAEAAAAGYRPCKRCRPDERNPATEKAAQVARLLEAEPQLSLGELGRATATAPEHLQRTFKAQTGVSPREYGAAQRVRRLKNELRGGESVLNAQLEAGYGSSRGMYEDAAGHLGMTPASYGKGGAGAHIVFTTARCALGVILVAQTRQGVCSIMLGDDTAELEAELRRQFPAAGIERGDSEVQEALGVMLRYLDGQLPHPELPLDVRATAFQWRVWKELRRIPPGETRTYAEVAAQMGIPSAVRAVARANATNPVAVVTPCHRVIGSDGKMRGYRWGLDRKEALLEREKAAKAR
jgi:AraC family transcriptional regulator of adaptative response/methylated-DNA-[protein]-cysteine methyltransferase